jgi:hypothetical protein
MSSKKTKSNPRLCPVKEHKSHLCRETGKWNQFSSLSLSTTKAAPHYQMLAIHTAFYLSFYILPRDLQGRLRSCKILNSTVSCGLVGSFISSYPSMSRNPIQSHYAPGRDIQCLLALSYQWRRCFGSLKSFQSRVTITANTNVLLWPSIHLNFINTGQDGIRLSLKNCNMVLSYVLDPPVNQKAL